MRFNKEQTERILESLLAICQESAEHGEMPSEVYADMFELSRELTDHLKDLQKKAVAA